MTEVNYKKRVRLNLSTSVKGVKTYDVTVEMIDEDEAVVLALHDKLVLELDKRYPAPIEELRAQKPPIRLEEKK